MKCEICGKGMKDMITLYRINPKGEIGKWRCWEDMDIIQRQINKDNRTFASIFNSKETYDIR